MESLLHAASIIFCHMDPTLFQAIMKDFCGAPCANSILQHFTTAFIEFNIHLVTMEMITTTTTHMEWTTFLISFYNVPFFERHFKCL
jgi:hypothetical protein